MRPRTLLIEHQIWICLELEIKILPIELWIIHLGFAFEQIPAQKFFTRIANRKAI